MSRWTLSRRRMVRSFPGAPLAPWPVAYPRYGRWVRARPLVGASVFQTPGGVQSELEQINDAFLAFSHEITEYVTSSPGYPNPTDPSAKGVSILFERVWTPLVQSWQSFYAQNKGWWDNLWWNHAPEAETFLRQLKEVRASAERLGMKVMSPAPATPASSVLDPEHGIWEDVKDTGKRTLEDTGQVLKTAAYAAIGLGVLLVATNVLRKQ